MNASLRLLEQIRTSEKGVAMYNIIAAQGTLASFRGLRTALRAPHFYAIACATRLGASRSGVATRGAGHY